MCEDVVKNKLLEHFRNMIVKKDPSRSKAYEAIGVTSFLRDWLTKKYADSDGNCKFEQIEQFVKTYLPQPTQWQALKARLVDGEPVRLLAKITVDIDIATGERSFGLSHYGLSSKDTLIADDVWEQNRESFVRTTEVWGQIELRYCKLDDDEGKIVLTKYSDFCPYTLDVDVYKEKRRAFTVEE